MAPNVIHTMHKLAPLGWDGKQGSCFVWCKKNMQFFKKCSCFSSNSITKIITEQQKNCGCWALSLVPMRIHWPEMLTLFPSPRILPDLLITSSIFYFYITEHICCSQDPLWDSSNAAVFTKYFISCEAFQYVTSSWMLMPAFLYTWSITNDMQIVTRVNTIYMNCDNT